jgi:tRNA-dihydrouridine synthase 1
MDKAKADGWTPPPIDSATGYKTLPIWAAQPLIRPIPVSSEVGGNEELVNEEIGAAPGSELRRCGAVFRCISPRRFMD